MDCFFIQLFKFILQFTEYKKREAQAESEGEGSSWVPLEAVDLLCCPKCTGEVALKEAEIDGNGISQGRITCSCGYQAEISGGMIICQGHTEETPFKVFENIDTVLAITDDFSPSYRKLIDKGHLWMYQKITAPEAGWDVIMTGPFSYNFLLKNLKSLPEKAVYIVTDVSIKKIEKMQKYFSDTDRKIVFIAGCVHHIPIKKSCVDLYIDDFSGNNYTFTYNENLFSPVSTHMKEGAKVVGLFVDYSMAPRSLENFKKDHEGFSPEAMKITRTYENFTSGKIRISDQINFGSPQGNKKDFVRQVGKEKISLIAYCGEKE